MKIKFYLLPLFSIILIFTACGGEAPQTQPVKKTPVPILPSQDTDLPSLLRSLDELAELERAGAWFQGLAITESTIRENAGDYAGSVAAAFKELTWAYSMGQIQKEDIEKGLLNALDIKGDENILAAANAILSFLREQWDDAAAGLEQLFNEPDEPDGFGRWMILVCVLEKNKSGSAAEDRRTGAAYKSIRARYSQFPEYWYRGARVFPGNIAAQYAENCINLSPQGPYADECRSILASNTGLKNEDGLSIKTKKEIEAIISLSVNSSNPQILDPLLPLISLPDNPYTVYAVSALKALTGIQKFNDYFNGHAAVSKGRLAERLSYICRS